MPTKSARLGVAIAAAVARGPSYAAFAASGSRVRPKRQRWNEPSMSRTLPPSTRDRAFRDSTRKPPALGGLAAQCDIDGVRSLDLQNRFRRVVLGPEDRRGDVAVMVSRLA